MYVSAALVVDGQVVSYGKVLKKDEAKALIEKIRGQPMRQKPKVAFVCVHNSCRSQIAEALGKLLAEDVFDSYSAGTETKPKINQDAVRLMKQLYGVDMEQKQHSKLLSEIPPRQAEDIAEIKERMRRERYGDYWKTP